MEIKKIIAWLDETLNVKAFDDVSNNGVQIERVGDEVSKVAFAVDGSAAMLEAAAAVGAQMLVVHHGISWGGGIKRIAGGEFNVVRAAMDGNVALYGVHLPLDAHPRLGHNALLAKEMKLKHLTPAFNYHGNVIGLIGVNSHGEKVGVCSGGAAAFAPEAKALGCVKLVTGEADWGEVIAAENVGIELDLRGHYESEMYGIRALAKEMKSKLKVEVVVLER